MFLFSAGAVYAQNSLSYIQVGSFNPKAADSGLMIGLGTAKMVDERVELGVSLDLFISERLDETDSTYYDTAYGADVTQKLTLFKSNLIMIPLMAYVNIKMPVEFPVVPYLSGSIGYDFVWNKFDDYQLNKDGTKFYGGFGWKIAIGGMYPLGSRSAFNAEIFYHGGKPTRNEDSIGNLPIRSEVDMSGLGVVVGLKFGGFGIF